MKKKEKAYWFWTGFYLMLGIALTISYFFGTNWLYIYAGVVLTLLGIARIVLAFKYKIHRS